DGATVFLPDRIALFPDRALNVQLYRWLAAWFAIQPVSVIGDADPLRRDLLTLRRVCEISALVVVQFPGLAKPYALLAEAIADARPRRPLPRIEQEVERIVMALLGAGAPAK